MDVISEAHAGGDVATWQCANVSKKLPFPIRNVMNAADA